MNQPRANSIVGGADGAGHNVDADTAQRPTKRIRIVPASESESSAPKLSTGIDEEVLGTMGIRRWNRRDPALRRQPPASSSSTSPTQSEASAAGPAGETRPRPIVEMSVTYPDGNEQLLDHLQHEVNGTQAMIFMSVDGLPLVFMVNA